MNYLASYFTILFYKIIRRVCVILGVSYSHSSDGEDYAIYKYLAGISNGVYIDIGSNHPIEHSNTFLFYLNGWRGMCIDPIPSFNKLYKYLRSRDLFLNAGIVPFDGSNKEMRFFIYKDFPDNSTFDIKRVEQLKMLFNRHPTDIVEVPVIDVHHSISLFKKRFGQVADVHLLSLDTEGYESAIIEQFFNLKLFPWVVCVEEIGHSSESVLKSPIFSIMRSNGYTLGAKTFLSSIYYKNDKLEMLPSLFVKELRI